MACFNLCATFVWRPKISKRNPVLNSQIFVINRVRVLECGPRNPTQFFLVTALPLPLNPCQLSVESNQAITLVLVLVLPGFEIA